MTVFDVNGGFVLPQVARTYVLIRISSHQLDHSCVQYLCEIIVYILVSLSDLTVSETYY